MGVRYPSVSALGFSTGLPGNANETAFIFTPPLTLPIDSAQVYLFWFATITAGTGVTSLQFRIRRGTTAAGAAISANVWTHTVPAGNLVCLSGMYVDSPGAAGGLQYALTCAQIGATAPSTIQDCSLLAFAL